MEAQNLKAWRKEGFDAPCEVELHTLKFRFLDTVVEYFAQLEGFELSNGSAFERFRDHSTRAY